MVTQSIDNISFHLKESCDFSFLSEYGNNNERNGTMKDIPVYDTFAKIEPFTKGKSGDKKCYIETIDGKRLLLRIADSSEYTLKRNEYDVMKEMYARNVPMPSPIIFGNCDNGKISKFVYTREEVMKCILNLTVK